MTSEEFIDKVKITLGDQLPKDLIFETRGTDIVFYNHGTINKESIIDFGSVKIDFFNESVIYVVDVIKHYHSNSLKTKSSND